MNELMRKILSELTDIAIVESPPRQEGRSINAVVMPKAQKIAAMPKPDSKPVDGPVAPEHG